MGVMDRWRGTHAQQAAEASTALEAAAASHGGTFSARSPRSNCARTADIFAITGDPLEATAEARHNSRPTQAHTFQTGIGSGSHSVQLSAVTQGVQQVDLSQIRVHNPLPDEAATEQRQGGVVSPAASAASAAASAAAAAAAAMASASGGTGGQAPHAHVHEEGSRASATPSAAGEDHVLLIQADAPLVDGLRALLVHHLKRSVGTSVINLSASQAELLEHHLSRLASYAQKIVHTLAFATRFLSKHQFEGDRGEAMDSPHIDSFANRAAAADGTYAGSMMGAAEAQQMQAAEVARPPRKSLKLNDDEILTLYRSAQMEAAIEADWRGIQGPSPGVAPAGSDAAVSTRSSNGVSARAGAAAELPTAAAAASGPGGLASAAATNGCTGGVISVVATNGCTSGSNVADAGTEIVRDDQEYLRIISRALQESGRSPRAFAAEVMEPRTGATCCRPNVPMLKGVMGQTSSTDLPNTGDGGYAGAGLDVGSLGVRRGH